MVGSLSITCNTGDLLTRRSLRTRRKRKQAEESERWVMRAGFPNAGHCVAPGVWPFTSTFVPEGHSTIARRFNAGLRVRRSESRRDG